MKFDPVTEEELQRDGLLSSGIYKYLVTKSEDKISKAGNEYTAITLEIYDDEGKCHVIFTNMSLKKLLKHFCDVNGMETEYKSGNLPPESFLRKSGGKVMIEIEGEKPNPNGGMYKAKNIVKDYIVYHHGSTTKPLPEKDDFINDDLPF